MGEGEVTSMRHLLAIIGVLAATVFSQSAFAETSRAIAIITDEGGGNAHALPFASLTKSIKRYENTHIIGIAEYDPVNCKFLDSGEWTDPTPTLVPKDSGKIQRTTVVKNKVGDPCNGLSLTYASINFDWTLRKNSSRKRNHGRPTTRFGANWSTKDGQYDVPYIFDIDVPVVRPKGDTSTFANWLSGPLSGTWGRWIVTFQPPDKDPSFDFTGEEVREEFISANEQCATKAPGVLGTGAVTPPGTPASWKVGELKGAGVTMPAGKNQWGWDFVGWNGCAIHAYRCAKATVPECGNDVLQGIHIKSPADDDFSEIIYQQSLREAIGGSIIPGDPRKRGFGPITSRRGEGVEPPLSVESNEMACGAAVLAILKKLPGGCYASPK